MSRSYGNILKCESHPHSPLVEDHRAGDMICSECGLVIGDRIIDVSSEWRTFANTNEKESTDMCRVGGVEDPTLGGADLGTSIGRGTGAASFDQNGKPIYRNRVSETTKEKNKRMANKELNEMAERLSVDRSVINAAQHVYESYQRQNTGKLRNTNAFFAACIYIACNNESVPRTFKEICAVSSSSKKEIGRWFKIIKKQTDNSNYTTTTPVDLVTRFCSKLNLPRNVLKLAEQVLVRAQSINSINGRSPATLASAAIYLATLNSTYARPLEDISRICGAAVTTIKQTTKVLTTSVADLVESKAAILTVKN